MPVGQKEYRRGVDLGLYPDQAREQRAQNEERRIQIAEQNALRQMEREQRTGVNDDIRTRLDLLRFENDDVKAKASASAEERVLTDSINATKKLLEVTATTSDFPTRLQKIIAEHPRALADKAFQEQYQWNKELHKGWLTQEQERVKLSEEQKRIAVEKAELSAASAGLPVTRTVSNGITRELPSVDQPDKLGTVTTGPKGEIVRTSRPIQPAGSAEGRNELLRQHALLDAELADSRGAMGGYNATKIGALNAVKSQLGYELLDPATGMVPKAAAAKASTVVSATATPAPVKTAATATPKPATTPAPSTPAPAANAPAVAAVPADIDDAIGGSFTGDKYLPAKTDVRRNKEGKLTGLPVLTRAQAQTLVSRGVMTPFIDAETGKVLRPQ